GASVMAARVTTAAYGRSRRCFGGGGSSRSPGRGNFGALLVEVRRRGRYTAGTVDPCDPGEAALAGHRTSLFGEGGPVDDVAACIIGLHDPRIAFALGNRRPTVCVEVTCLGFVVALVV